MNYLKILKDISLEIIGTFLFVSILITQKNPLIIGLSLIILMYIAEFLAIKDPGVHFNPIVSIIILLEKQYKWHDALKFIICQLIGGLIAWKIWSNYNIIKKF